MIIKQSDKELCKCAAKDKQSLLGCKSFNLVPRFSTSSRYVGLRLRIPLLCPGFSHIQIIIVSNDPSDTVLAVCEYVICQIMARERLQLRSWNLTSEKDTDERFWLTGKFDVAVVSMATWTIEYNLEISLLLSLHKVRSLDFPINLHTAYYN